MLTERISGEDGSNRGQQSSEVGETRHRDGMGSVRDVDNLSLLSITGAMLDDDASTHLRYLVKVQLLKMLDEKK